ncbi:MAG TPA: glycosyltransferase family 4 protein [Pirellulales bacterium]|nr:glycosyltransferase family 4 protein [Pirellulales bacterium]
MHIAMIYDAVYPFVIGGAEKRHHAVARDLCREHRVSIYGYRYWTDDRRGCIPGCEYVALGTPLDLYGSGGRRRCVEAVVFAVRLFFSLLRAREDLWDLVNFPFFSVPVARLVSVLRGRVLIVTWHEFWGDYWYEYLGWRGIIGKMVERFALKCSPRIVVSSEHTRRRLCAAGYDGARITVVPCGLAFDEIAAVAPAPEGTDLVYVGRLAPHKRVDLLLEALKLLRDAGREVTLSVVGEGPERDRLEKRAADLGIREHVTFTGALHPDAAVYARLKASRVFVSGSEREGFGIAAIEAWACGIPTIVTSAPGNATAELVDCDCKGRVVIPTAPAIALACGELLDTTSELTSNTLVSMAARFDWPLIAARLRQVYADALEAAHGASLPGREGKSPAVAPAVRRVDRFNQERREDGLDAQHDERPPEDPVPRRRDRERLRPAGKNGHGDRRAN